MKKALHEVTTWKDVLGGFAPIFRHGTRTGVICEAAHCDQTTTKADMYSLILRPSELTEDWAPIAINYVNEDSDADHKIVDQVSVSFYADDLDKVIELLQAARDAHQQRVKVSGVTQ